MAEDYNRKPRNVHTERLRDPSVSGVANDKAENIRKAQVNGPTEPLAGDM
jgi:hypothetical protein